MLSAVDTHLDGRQFLAGDKLGANVSVKPKVAACIDRVNARPAMLRAWAA